MIEIEFLFSRIGLYIAINIEHIILRHRNELVKRTMIFVLLTMTIQLEQHRNVRNTPILKLSNEVFERVEVLKKKRREILSFLLHNMSINTRSLTIDVNNDVEKFQLWK